MFEDGSSLVGRIRNRYRFVYADGTKSEWGLIPDPDHPAFSYGEEWDTVEGPGICLEDFERVREEAMGLGDVDMDMLDSFPSYVSGFTVMVPAEYNERMIAPNRFECDIEPQWILSYSYVPEDMIFHIDGLRRSDTPIDRVEGVELSIMLSDAEYEALLDIFPTDRSIGMEFINSISDRYHAKHYDYGRYKIGECCIPVHDRGGEPVHELVISLSVNQFCTVQQIAYGNPRDVGDLMV